ncbi:hypothetical protein [Kistimonas asteriae]|uniref:hypothetical protein n=1 Tax=Kistimonas asteriae TaxID=517724 RepID=UPI001BA82867|nr:hypothetical protein [Kistimonas asteriae]
MPEVNQPKPNASPVQSTMEWLGNATFIGAALWGVFSVTSLPVTISFGLGIAAGNQKCREKFVEGSCYVAGKVAEKMTDAASATKALCERQIELYQKDQEYRNYDRGIPNMEESEIKKLSKKSKPLAESWIKFSFV